MALLKVLALLIPDVQNYHFANLIWSVILLTEQNSAAKQGKKRIIFKGKGDIKMVAYVIASMVVSVAFNASLIAKEHSYK